MPEISGFNNIWVNPWFTFIVAQCVGDIKAYQRLYTPYGSPLIDHRAIYIWQRHVTLPYDAPYAYGTVVN